MSIWETFKESSAEVLENAIKDDLAGYAGDFFKRTFTPPPAQQAPPPAPVAVSAPSFQMPAMTQMSFMPLILAGIGLIAILLFKGK